jgi:hypothetical protein
MKSQTLGWLPTSFFRGSCECTAPGCYWWGRQPHPPQMTLPGRLVQSANGWTVRPWDDCPPVDLATFRGPTELNVNHGRQTGGFFASAVRFLAFFSWIFQLFLAISNFDPFYRRSNFVRSSFDP